MDVLPELWIIRRLTMPGPLIRSSPSRSLPMQEVLVALAYVAMAACPATFAAFPQRDFKDEA
jgi:hypothetical protein